MSRLLSYTILALLLSLMITIKSCNSIQQERNRFADNQRTLLDKAYYYETQNRLSVASVERLTLRASELEDSKSELVEICDDLRIKVKRLQSASTTVTQTKYEFKTIFKDSVIVRNGAVLDTIKCMSYKDPWLRFEGCTSDNLNFDVQIESRDTIIQIVHRVPRKFWFIKWGTKAIRQEVISKNPYSKITYSEYIELKK